MTDNLSIRLVPDTLRTIDSSTFTGSYQAVGTKLLNAGRIAKFTNNSSVAITLSWDGVNDHEYLPAGSQFVIDVTTNAGNGGWLFIPGGTVFYVKGSAGTGSVYISLYYA